MQAESALPCPAKHQSMKRRQHLPFAEFKAKNRSRQIMCEKYGIGTYGDMTGVKFMPFQANSETSWVCAARVP